jgi:hypothetical protein
MGHSSYPPSNSPVLIGIRDLTALRRAAVFGITGPTHNMEWLKRIDKVLESAQPVSRGSIFCPGAGDFMDRLAIPRQLFVNWTMPEEWRDAMIKEARLRG